MRTCRILALFASVLLMSPWLSSSTFASTACDLSGTLQLLERKLGLDANEAKSFVSELTSGKPEGGEAFNAVIDRTYQVLKELPHPRWWAERKVRFNHYEQVTDSYATVSLINLKYGPKGFHAIELMELLRELIVKNPIERLGKAMAPGETLSLVEQKALLLELKIHWNTVRRHKDTTIIQRIFRLLGSDPNRRVHLDDLVRWVYNARGIKLQETPLEALLKETGHLNGPLAVFFKSSAALETARLLANHSDQQSVDVAITKHVNSLRAQHQEAKNADSVNELNVTSLAFQIEHWLLVHKALRESMRVWQVEYPEQLSTATFHKWFINNFSVQAARAGEAAAKGLTKLAALGVLFGGGMWAVVAFSGPDDFQLKNPPAIFRQLEVERGDPLQRDVMDAGEAEIRQLWEQLNQINISDPDAFQRRQAIEERIIQIYQERPELKQVLEEMRRKARETSDADPNANE